LAETIERKFEVLDKVRAIKVGNKLEPTISIGFSGEEKNLSGLGQKAQSCLDLALGRGGDQAVVAQNGEMLFFGAKGTVQAKNTRVRARIVAQAIHELLSAANKVFVMGHMNEDYDSIGASIGVAKMALDLKKETYIVTSGQGPSLARLETVSKDQAKFYMNLVVNEDEALKYVSDDSLLILVDHHREMITAAPKVLKAIRKKVIIDHHRRAEDAIKDVILQYMEPSSSSSSELVTEILQYFDDKLQLTPVEATALYAGIIVDTKNFAVQTGQRTFEAAAFLRGSGADPKMVFQLFRDTEQTIVKRAKIIAEMKIPIPGVAISVFRNAPDSPEVSLIVAQAADELLTMDDIKVSVVMSENAQGVGISARSDGTVNVQVMMEELGGGGHQTVAGVQAKGITADELIPKIITMAKEQMKENDKDESNSIAGREEVGKKGGDN
jgi:c-di-AMP phosphodiesterase-like protein